MSTKNELIEDNMRLVYYIVSREYPTYLRDEDIIQSGMVGLCNAAKHWNGNGKFSSYAGKCIKNEIKKEFIRRKKHDKNISLETEVGEDGTLNDLLVGDDDVGYIDDAGFYHQLTQDEKEVLTMGNMGFSNAEISEMTGHTVQKIQKIFRLIKIKWRNYYGN